MTIEHILLLIGVGLVAGIINVMAGGGSLLTLPSLVFLGLPGPVANGSNRLAILLQNAVATYQFFRDGYSDFKLSLTLTLCALPGTILGAWAGTHLGGVWFNRVLAGVMVIVMFLMAQRKKKKPKKDSSGGNARISSKRYYAALGLMLLVGFYGGFIQAGVGFIIMAVLHRVLGLDLIRVNMHKVFIVGAYTIVALFVFAISGEVNWIAGLTLAAGNMTGGILGTKLAIKKGEKIIKIFLYVVLTVMVIKLLFFQ